MAEGYYREAVSSFAAALERFYEYMVRVVAFENNLYSNFDMTWKNIGNQSQVELGAYMMTHLMQFKTVAPTLSKKNKELRNKVIHKGYMSNQAESETFAVDVAKVIELGTHKLEKNCSKGMQSYIERNYNKISEPEKDLILGYCCFRPSSLDKIESELKEYIARLSKAS